MAKNTSLNTGTVPLPVEFGGTGDASLTAYAVLCGGTTSTGAVQSIAGLGTAGQVLTSNGAGALPTFQAGGGGGGGGLNSVQVFTTTGTWNRPVGVTKIIVEILSAGGGGGGPRSADAGATSQGGGGGAYGKLFLDVSAISTAAITIGAGGTAGGVDSNGSAGGTTSFGAYISATGGSGGSYTAAYNKVTNGGLVTGGSVNGYGQSGAPGGTANAARGWGANSVYGQGGGGAYSSANATAAFGYGAGGGGGLRTGGATNWTATDGTQGIIIVWEYA